MMQRRRAVMRSDVATSLMPIHISHPKPPTKWRALNLQGRLARGHTGAVTQTVNLKR